jgi:hypothetical protein
MQCWHNDCNFDVLLDSQSNSSLLQHTLHQTCGKGFHRHHVKFVSSLFPHIVRKLELFSISVLDHAFRLVFKIVAKATQPTQPLPQPLHTKGFASPNLSTTIGFGLVTSSSVGQGKCKYCFYHRRYGILMMNAASCRTERPRPSLRNYNM